MPPKRVVKTRKVKEEPEEGDEERAKKVQAVKDDVRALRASGIAAPVLDIDDFCEKFMEKLSQAAEEVILGLPWNQGSMPETWYPKLLASYRQPSREHAQCHASPVDQVPQPNENPMKPAQLLQQGMRQSEPHPDPSKQLISADTLADCFSMLRMLQANEEFMSILSDHDKSMFDGLVKRYVK